MQALSPTWNLSTAAPVKWYARALPSLVDLAFLLPAVLLFLKLKGTKTLFADADTGWHIKTGEWIIQHRAVPTHDLFSFSKAGQPWFAWEWAWDVVFAALHGVAGLAAVGFVNILILGLVSVLLYTLLRRVSQNDAVSFLVSALAMSVSSIHWLARPHLVSWLFVVVFLHLIQTAEEGNRKALYWTPGLMLLWTNLHGGFAAGIVILVAQAAGLTASDLMVFGWKVRGSVSAALRNARPYWTAAALSIAATFINPYGWHLHQHIFGYLTDKELLGRISEFQSISFHSGSAGLFEAMLGLSACAAFWKLQQGMLAPALGIVFWAHFALLSARHIPLFAFIAAPTVAAFVTYVLGRAKSMAGVAEAATTVSEICEELRAMEQPPRLHVLSATAVILLAILFAAGKQPFLPEFDADTFPAQAMRFVSPRAGNRIFTYDQWGDYLIYRFYPAQKVFFDGRSDFYGNDFAAINQRLVGAEHDWKKVLRSFGIQMVILKPEAPLVAVLKITPGSQVLFDDGKVIVIQIDGIYQRALASKFGPPTADDRKTLNHHYSTTLLVQSQSKPLANNRAGFERSKT